MKNLTPAKLVMLVFVAMGGMIVLYVVKTLTAREVPPPVAATRIVPMQDPNRPTLEEILQLPPVPEEPEPPAPPEPDRFTSRVYRRSTMQAQRFQNGVPTGNTSDWVDTNANQNTSDDPNQPGANDPGNQQSGTYNPNSPGQRQAPSPYGVPYGQPGYPGGYGYGAPGAYGNPYGGQVPGRVAPPRIPYR